MTLSIRALAYLGVLLFVAKTIDASFAYCVGLKGPAFFGREVVGFKLWNEGGEEAAQYRTIFWARKTRMENNGWYLDLKFEAPLFLLPTNLSISHDVYGDIGEVPLVYRCGFSGSTLYYGCYSNDANDYCLKNFATYMGWCRTQLAMGSDSFTC